MRIGNSVLMLSDEHPDFGALAPPTIGGSPVKFHITVDDADAFTAQAVAAGATLLRPLEDQFYGMRSGMVADPFGHSWFIAAPLEDVDAGGNSAPLQQGTRGRDRLKRADHPAGAG